MIWAINKFNVIINKVLPLLLDMKIIYFIQIGNNINEYTE